MMNAITRLRQIPAGAYFHGDGSDIFKLEDVPTDGPLLTQISREDERDGETVQVEPKQFDDEFTRVRLREGEMAVMVEYESGGAEHVFTFGYVDGDKAWPKTMMQGGEMYRIGLQDVPSFVETLIEVERGLKLEER